MEAVEHTRTRWIAALAVAAIIALAACAVRVGTAPNGPGLSVDSASYELAATSLRDDPDRVAAVLNGIFPPGYPAAIAAASPATSTARDAAVLVNVVALAAIMALVALAAFGARRRDGLDQLLPPVAAALLLGTSAAMLRWTGYVMAELVSMAWTMAAVVAAITAVTRPRWLVAVGVAAGMAGIARHGALATIPTLAVLSALLVQDGWARLRTAATIVGVGAATWCVGTRLLLGGPPESNRVVAWHPPTGHDLAQLVDTVGGFWLPSALGTFGIRAAVLLALLAVAVAGARAVRSGALARVPAAAVLSGGLVLAHLITLAASRAWLDQAIVADDRLVLPIVPLVVLAIVAAWPADTSSRPALRVVAGVSLVVVLGAQAERSLEWVHESRREGLEYGQRRFGASPTLTAVRAMPDDILVWSNEVSLLSLRADRQSLPIPSRTNSYSGLGDPAFEANLDALRESVADGAAVVYVEGFTMPRILAMEELMTLVPGLTASPYPDGVILRSGG